MKRGAFLMAVLALAGSSQGAVGQDATAAFKGGLAEVSGWIVKAAELVPEDKYGFKPTANVRSFGQLVGHIADGNNYYCGRAAGTNVQWAETVEKSGANKAALIAKLKESFDKCAAATTASAKPNELLANIGHASLHYGNMIVYLRLQNLVPPSS